VPVSKTSWRDSVANISKAMQVPDLRKRLLFVAGMFAVFVLGLHIPAPFVNPEKIKDLTGLFTFIDMLSGGGFKRLSILALGIVPYINASIIMQLLGIAVPAVQRLQKEGETGRKTLSLYTRWGTVILAILQAAGLGYYLFINGAVEHTWGVFSVVPLVLVMAAGTSFLMWMGEQLTDKGIGNGVSLIIFAGIMIRLPLTMQAILQMATQQVGATVLAGVIKVIVILIIFLAIVVFITWVNQATRQIPIQHAKRVVGNRVFNSANTYLPLKVVTAGVIPIIFAISLAMLPRTFAGYLKQHGDRPWIEFIQMLSPGYSGSMLAPSFTVIGHTITIPFGAIIGGLLYFLLVVFFTYFYTAVVYNVQDIADNLKKHGSFVPGLRPGKQTEHYIDMVLTRITFAGALFLGIVALLPYIIPAILGGSGSEASLFPLWGGTSLLIVVGVALESMKQLEAHLVMRHYEGFIK